MKHCLFLLLALAAASASAANYRWTDAQGKVHYTDKPPPAGVESKAIATSPGASKLYDVDAVPYLDEKGRADYRTFLTYRTPRAFFICQGGGHGAVWGAPSQEKLEQHLKEALAQPQAQAHGCKVYAINETVVWGG